jgi:hypothetical protein
MRDWHPMAWIAYLSLGITVCLNALGAATREGMPFSDWFSPLLKTYVFGYGPAIFLMIATLLFVIDWQKSKKSATIVKHPVPILPSTQVPAKPKKFYSDRNKSELADALTDLSEIINKLGFAITDKSNYIVTILQMPTDRISAHDIINLIRELEEMEDLSNKFNQGIYGGKGFLKTHATYHDELSPILQVNLIITNNKQVYDHPIRLVDANINSLINELKAIQLATKHDDQNLINSMITNTKRNVPNCINAMQRFNEWLKEIQKRIDVFKNSELKVN